ncbi:MAG: prenyltransferase/squalene oxidase repeat-containing protein, partial [Planctomycetota bacterium]
MKTANMNRSVLVAATVATLAIVASSAMPGCSNGGVKDELRAYEAAIEDLMGEEEKVVQRLSDLRDDTVMQNMEGSDYGPYLSGTALPFYEKFTAKVATLSPAAPELVDIHEQLVDYLDAQTQHVSNMSEFFKVNAAPQRRQLTALETEWKVSMQEILQLSGGKVTNVEVAQLMGFCQSFIQARYQPFLQGTVPASERPAPAPAAAALEGFRGHARQSQAAGGEGCRRPVRQGLPGLLRTHVQHASPPGVPQPDRQYGTGGLGHGTEAPPRVHRGARGVPGEPAVAAMRAPRAVLVGASLLISVGAGLGAWWLLADGRHGDDPVEELEQDPRTRKALRELEDLLEALSRGELSHALAGVLNLIDSGMARALDPASVESFDDARRETGSWAFLEADGLARAGDLDGAETMVDKGERVLAGTGLEEGAIAVRDRIDAEREKRRVAREEAARLAAERPMETAQELVDEHLSKGNVEAAIRTVEELLGRTKDRSALKALNAEKVRLEGILNGVNRRRQLRKKADRAIARGRYGQARSILGRLVAMATDDPTMLPDEAEKDKDRLEALDDLQENREPPVLDAVRKGLRWMAKQQFPDGSFSWTVIEGKAKGYNENKRAKHPHRIGLTALAAHALLGHVRFDYNEEFGPALDRSIAWILKQQRDDGSFSRNLYEHSLCTLVLVDADRMLYKSEVRPHVAKALKFLQEAANEDGAWRYRARVGPSDMSVTGWALQALLHAKRGRYEVKQEVLDAAFAWVERMTDPSGRVGYKDPGRGSWAMTGAALFCRLRNGEGSADHRVKQAADLLIRYRPDKNWRHGSYQLFYVSDAMS